MVLVLGAVKSLGEGSDRGNATRHGRLISLRQS